MESLTLTDAKTLRGIARVGAFSTVDRSVVLPVFNDLIRAHPGVQLELRSLELRQLPGLLYSGAVDVIVGSQALEKQGIENHRLGEEEYVLIRSSGKFSRDEIYLDYDEEDQTTLDFFKIQSRKSSTTLKQNFMNDIYLIIDAVRAGVGRAVVPRHLIRDIKGIEVVKGYQPLRVPVYLSYYTQAFYTELQARVIDAIKTGAPSYLKV
jgi:DNA-binding transcriptional LysR family regulator